MKDYTFSDGTFVPEGTFVAVASKATHTDENIYPRANEFQPFRFSTMRDKDIGTEDMASKYGMVSLGTNHVPFGHGKHAWYVVMNNLVEGIDLIMFAALDGSSQRRK